MCSDSFLLDGVYKCLSQFCCFSHSKRGFEVDPFCLTMALSFSSMGVFLSTFLFCFSLGAEARTSPVSSVVSEELFNSIFLHKDNAACPAKNFYTYDSFIMASRSFRRFGSCGSLTTRKREVAAFLAQISHETTGGWATAPDGPYAWGLCFKEEVSPQSDYCDSTNQQWPCFPGKTYKGRGPIQLSWYTCIIHIIFDCFLLSFHASSL